MGFDNLKEIIDFAIEKEKEAAAFYESCAEMESMSGIRQMLLEFAAEEKKHQAMLENLAAGNVIQGLADYKFKWITDIHRSDYSVALEYRPGMPYNEVLLLASQREEKALALYNRLLDNAQEDESRDLFKVLCQEEARHKLFLETQYDDYMARMGD